MLTFQAYFIGVVWACYKYLLQYERSVASGMIRIQPSERAEDTEVCIQHSNQLPPHPHHTHTHTHTDTHIQSPSPPRTRTKYQIYKCHSLACLSRKFSYYLREKQHTDPSSRNPEGLHYDGSML